MNKKWTIIDALRHSRNDWSTSMQLLKCNPTRGKVEEIHSLIDRSVQVARQESNLPGLSMPLFSEWILT